MATPGALSFLMFLAFQATFPLPGDLPNEPYVDIDLVGVVGVHTYTSGERTQKDSALTLLAPIELDVGSGEPPLRHVVVVQLLAWSDAAIHQFSLHYGQPVHVRCRMTVSTMWGYRHASCSPIAMRVGT